MLLIKPAFAALAPMAATSLSVPGFMPISALVDAEVAAAALKAEATENMDAITTKNAVRGGQCVNDGCLTPGRTRPATAAR